MLLKRLYILLIPDQHNIREMPGLPVQKACDLLSGTD